MEASGTLPLSVLRKPLKLSFKNVEQSLRDQILRDSGMASMSANNNINNGSSSNKQPHALAIPITTQGHISPLLQLCKALASRGVAITFVITEDIQRKLASFLQAPGSIIRFEIVPNGLPVPLSDFDVFSKDNRLLFFQAVQDMQKPVEELVEAINARGPPVSCIISDLMVPWPREVAARLGVPNVIFWTAPAAFLLLEHNLPEMMKRGDVPVKDPSTADVITYLPGLSPFPVWALPSSYSAKDEVLDPGFTRRWNRTRSIADDAWILINSFEEIEQEAFKAMRRVNPNFVGVGPLLLLDSSASSHLSLWTEDDECLRWLDKQKAKSVLYISFGSLASITFEQFLELAAGLEELQQPFLWAIRPNSVSGMKIEVFDAFKSRVAEAGFGMVSSWAPQVQILKHGSTGGFLSHCGWNSTMESICAGVPIICWPCVAEQNLNCKMVVEDWKIGIRFSKQVYQELVYKHEFVDVFKKLMEDGHSLRRNVEKLAQAAHQSVSHGGSSSNNLEAFFFSITNQA